MNNTSTRGRTFTGVVVSDKMSKTVTVEWTRRNYIQKYERYEKRRTRVKAHNPDEIDAVEGDLVTVKETRPLSKTKHFIIIKKHMKDGEDVILESEEADNEDKKNTSKTATKKTTKKAVKKTTKKTTKKTAKKADE